jgi:hypothetical protein
MIVLGLDQSSQCGWAVGETGGKARFGTYAVPDFGGHEGRTIRAFRDWLINFIKSEGVDRCFWEQVYFPPSERLDSNIVFKLVSYANAIQLACVETNIDDAYVSSSEWRLYFLGMGAAPKHTGNRTAWLKEAAMQAALAQGYACGTHHEAEAIGIWQFGCQVVDKNCRWLHRPRLRRQGVNA